MHIGYARVSTQDQDAAAQIAALNKAGCERIFWSLIPFWRQNEQGTRVMHDGNPAQD